MNKIIVQSLITGSLLFALPYVTPYSINTNSQLSKDICYHEKVQLEPQDEHYLGYLDYKRDTMLSTFTKIFF